MSLDLFRNLINGSGTADQYFGLVLLAIVAVLSVAIVIERRKGGR